MYYICLFSKITKQLQFVHSAVRATLKMYHNIGCVIAFIFFFIYHYKVSLFIITVYITQINLSLLVIL